MDNSVRSPPCLPGRTGSGFRAPAPRQFFPFRHASRRCWAPPPGTCPAHLAAILV